MNIFEAEKNFDPLVTDIHQAQKSMLILRHIHQFLRDNRYHGLVRDDLFMANWDAHKIAMVISLGKIYDSDPSAHSTDYLMQWLHRNRNEFTKDSLIARKVAEGKTEAEAREYATGFLGIDDAQIAKLAAVRRRLKGIYDAEARNLRNQAFAHRERGAEPSGVDFGVADELANGARGIYEDLFQAFHNAKDFSLQPRTYPYSDGLERDLNKFFEPHRDKRITW
jgi:hypothetical protein